VTAVAAPVPPAPPAPPARWRPAAVYALVSLLGAAAFLYPFWLPEASLPDSSHAGDAPLLAAAVGALAVVAVLLEIRRGTMTGATVALLGVLGACAALLRLLDLPGGGSGLFFLVVLAGAAFGPRFGLLLGLLSMALSAALTGGIGPWLPFQMLALGWLGGSAGWCGSITKALPVRAEVAVLAVFGWLWGFVYGAIMNLWFWPFSRNLGPLSWEPGSGLGDTVAAYWRFYTVTSLPWDAAGALANAVLIAVTGTTLLASLRRVAHRLDPQVLPLDDERDQRDGRDGPDRVARSGPAGQVST
jgi:energy-coupling factor transport system substrate-specific component